MNMIKSNGKKLLRVIRFAAFVAVFLGMVWVINHFVTYDLQYNGDISGFYEMEEDTVDVLLLGSSQMGAGINPQDIYDEAGIRSYNISSFSQSLWLSYYWLKETLLYQSPQVVVLECYELFNDLSENEVSSRWGLDDMRFGPVKLQAAATVCELNDSQNFFSYVLNNIRYHERWDSLIENDWFWLEGNIFHQSKGFFLEWDICQDDLYEPISLSAAAEAEPAAFDATAEKYLDKITALCEAKGIELILLKTTTVSQTAERHAAIQSYADAHGLAFYDFNMEDLYG